MDKKWEEVIGKEDSVARQIQLARETAQAAHPLSGLRSKAPSVFEWTEDEKTGFLLWKSQHYNSVRHEWDLCYALAPDTTKIIIVPEVYEDSDSDVEFTYKQPKTLNDLVLVPTPPKVHDYISSITSPELTPHSPIPSSSTAIDPAALVASRDLIPSTVLLSSYNCELSPISPTMPLLALALEDVGDPIPSSSTAIDPAALVASCDLIPLTALPSSYNFELSPISPAMPLLTLALEDVGEMVSAHEVHREAVEASAADSAEPREMHSLIYDGSPSPISLLSFTDMLLDVLWFHWLTR
ncbi:hypothetical protein PILCRDRAFT_6735 [Piloderma croceum F 1598]|uniref:Uncharacterized protein n=1 Tax=Piloderma croceum (strain F 1598) TaxID=765440 RepID=A0A0C3BC26_PILCF|nr:hypothetical protein PILCRDRAFT_6735 [Piloderma croceum F 1598]